MPAALQCPDCGHQEMLDNLGGVSTFRCGGCGRALKVPAQFRRDGGARGAPPGSRAPGPGEPTQAMPRVSPGVTPVVGAPLPPVGPASIPTAAPPLVGGGRADLGVSTTRSPIAFADGPVGPVEPPGPLPGPMAAAAPPPGSLKPPLILRLILWVLALPLGSLIVFAVASSLNVLTKSQLEDTFLLAGWGRFLPIARLLPFCALATALLVQLGVFGLEWRRARMLRTRPPGGRGPRGGTRPGPSEPLAPNGRGQRATNGARSRDRAIS